MLDASVHKLLQGGVRLLLVGGRGLHLLDTSVAYLGQLSGSLFFICIDALDFKSLACARSWRPALPTLATSVGQGWVLPVWTLQLVQLLPHSLVLVPQLLDFTVTVDDLFQF